MTIKRLLFAWCMCC